MATNTPQPLLPRENQEADYQSVVRQYDMVAHLLHLPQRSELNTLPATEAVVAQRLVAQVQRIRGALTDAAGMETQLQNEFRAERTLSQEVATGTISNSARIAEYAIADAWLKVITRHFGEDDIRGMIAQIPAAIRTVALNGRWTTTATIIVPPVTTAAAHGIEIDISQPPWSSGTLQQVRASLIGRTPREVKMIITDAGGMAVPDFQLNEATVDLILAGQCNVVNPILPLQVVNLDGVPISGVNTTVDLPGLIRLRPPLANMNEAALIAALTPGGVLAVNYAEYIQCVNTATNARGPVLAADVPFVITHVFRQLSRPPNQPIASSPSSLSDALTGREPLDRLLRGSADNRELLLALATLQHDPQAGRVLNANAETNRLQTEIQTNSRLLHAVENMELLRTAQLPTYDHTTTTNGIAATQSIASNLLSHFDTALSTLATTPPGTYTAPPLNIPGVLGLNPAQTAAFAPLRINVAITPRRIVTAAGAIQDNHNVCQSIVDRAQEANRECRESQQHRTAIADMLNVMGETLSHQGLTHADLGTAGLTALVAHLLPTAPLQASVNAISPATNRGALVTEFQRAMNSRGVMLQGADHYRTRAPDLQTQFLAAQAKVTQVSGGSEACWAVIQEGLTNQGMRGDELKNTLAYMRAKVQATPESMRNIQDLADQEHPASQTYSGFEIGNDDGAVKTVAKAVYNWISGAEDSAEANWNEGKEYRSILGLGERYDAFGEYKANLFTHVGIGMTLNDNPRSRAFSLPQIYDAYFKTKYLYDLPASDPLHIPHSAEIDRFLNRLHAAILERAQVAVNADLLALKGFGADIDQSRLNSMTMTERVQWIQDELRSDHYYTDRNKSRITRMAEAAFAPVKKKLQAFEKRNERIGNFVGGLNPLASPKWYNPVTWPRAILYDGIAKTAYGIGSGIVGGASNVVTSQAKAVSENKLGTVAGGALAAWATAGIVAPWLAIPAGLLIGANYLRKKAAAGNAAPHEGSHA